MTVTVSKSAINFREELSALKKPSGIKGEELLRTNTAAEVYKSINPTMYRNRVINGDMIVSQRYGDSSFATVGNVLNTPFGYYTSANYAACVADKTFIADNTGTSATGTAQRVAVTDTSVPCTYALRFTRTSSSSGRTSYDSRFQHNVEGYLLSDVNENTPITASFYARASKTGRATYALWVDGGGGYYVTIPVDLTTSWKRYTVTAPGISRSYLLGGTNRGFGTGLYWSNTWWSSSPRTWSTTITGSSIDDYSSTGDWIEFTGHQIEVSPTVTPFEFRPYNVELPLCQRYCYVVSGDSGYRVGQGWAYSTTSANISFNFPVQMRGSPSLAFASAITYNDQIAGYTLGTPILNASSQTFATLQATGGSGLTARAPGAAYFTSNSSLIVLTADV